MEFALAQLVNGVALGAIYAIAVTGFNLLLLVGGIFQFAYPPMVVLSMYILWLVLEATGGNVALGILAAIGSGIGLSFISEPLFRPLVKRRAAMGSFILAIGLSAIFLDIICRQIHRGIPIGFHRTLTGGEALVRYGIATLTVGQLATILGCVGAVVGFLYLLYRTQQGRALRAMGQNPSVASLLGIPVARMSRYSFLIAGLLAGVSAVFLAMALGTASGLLGSTLAIKVIAVAVFAGLGNLRGGLICGVIMALAESFTIGYLSGDLANAIAFGMIMVAVFWKPEGVFGTQA